MNEQRPNSTQSQERPELKPRQFNPNDHLVQLKSRDGLRDYLPVQWRLVWFRQRCPNGSIETEMIHLDLDRETEEEIEAWNEEHQANEKVVKQAKGVAVFRAVVKDGKGGVGVGTKSEKAASFPDYIEKAETGAIGRALAALGYGTQFAPELDEEHRIVDAPVTRGASTPAVNGRRPVTAMRPISNNGRVVAQDESHTPATEQQLASIRKLCEHLSKPAPDLPENMSFADARELIAQLSHEYRLSRNKGTAGRKTDEPNAA
jgi:hypothetical protein